MISILSLAHDRDKNLEFTIKFWKNQTYKNFELNIIETANLNSTIEILQKFKNDIKINCWRLHTKYVNKTFALNFLAKKSLGDFLCIWDVDLIKNNNYLENCLSIIDNDSFVLQQAKYLNNFFTNKVFEENLNFYEIKEIEETNRNFVSCPGSGVPGQIFVNKKDYFFIGGMDERIFGWGPEDSDFRDRLIRLGKKQKIEESCSYHLEHSVKNNYQKTVFSSKTENYRIYENNNNNKIIVVDNSKINWSENLWNKNSNPERINL